MKKVLTIIVLAFCIINAATSQNLISSWSANGSTDVEKSLPNLNGWGCTTPNLQWGYANSTSYVVRYMDYNATTTYSSSSAIRMIHEGTPFKNRIMLLRWDNGGNSTEKSIYTLKLGPLNSNIVYKFKWKYSYFNNGSAIEPLILFAKVVNSRDGLSGVCSMKNFKCSLTRGLLQSDSLYFKPVNSTDTLYLSIAASAFSMSAIADLSLEETTLQPQKVTIDVQTPGTLSSLISKLDWNLVDTLKISGNIDARDFKSMNLAINKSVLNEIDLSHAHISAYSGAEGTVKELTDYLENAIPANAFPSTTIIRSYVLPDSATTIGKDAFSYCFNVQKVTIPASISTIEDGAFLNAGCMLLVHSDNSHFCENDGVLFNKSKTILIHCSCNKTGEYILPNSIESLSTGAFMGCSGLTKISIPESLTSIGYAAFENCISLRSISIPSLVTFIGDRAFYNCQRLVSLFSKLDAPIDLSQRSNVFFGISKILCGLYIPSGSVEMYSKAPVWNDFRRILVANADSSNEDLSLGIVAYYPFNGNANDESGNNLHGSLQNEVYFEPGVLGQSLRVVGNYYVISSTGGHVLLPYIDFNSMSQFTISLWVKEQELLMSDGEAYLFYGSHSSQNISIGHFDKMVFQAGAKAISYPFDSSAVNCWVNYSMTYKDGLLIAFRNGKEVGRDSTVEINLTTTNGGIARHWWTSTSTRLSGMFDEIMIYNRALNLNEINELHSYMNTPINPQKSNSISVYSNHKKIIVENAEGWTVKIVDLLGKVVLPGKIDQKMFELPLNRNGVYISIFTKGNQVCMRKVLVHD